LETVAHEGVDDQRGVEGLEGFDLGGASRRLAVDLELLSRYRRQAP